MTENKGWLRRAARWWNYLLAVWFVLWTIGAVIAATRGEWWRLTLVMAMIGLGVVVTVAGDRREKRLSAKLS